MVFNAITFLVTRPLIVPAVFAASGLYYGSSELTFGTIGTFITFDPKKFPVAFLTAHFCGIGILFWRSRGKLNAPMKYHLTTIIAGGVTSGVVRSIMKVKLSLRASKNSSSSSESTE